MITLISVILCIGLFVKLFGLTFTISWGIAKIFASLIIGLTGIFLIIVTGVVLFIIPILIIIGIINLCKFKPEKIVEKGTI